jgi:hypothetical protein
LIREPVLEVRSQDFNLQDVYEFQACTCFLAQLQTADSAVCSPCGHHADLFQIFNNLLFWGPMDRRKQIFSDIFFGIQQLENIE